MASAYQWYSQEAPAAPAKRRNGLGIVSLAAAVVALLSVWSVLGGIVFGIVAAWSGFAARTRVARGEADNDAVAVAGTMLRMASILVALLNIPAWVGFIRFRYAIPTTATSWQEPRRTDICSVSARIENDVGAT